MGNVTLPHPLTDGSTAYGSQVRANDDAIVAQVNGNIDDQNIKTNAGIQGTKLSNTAGQRIPTDRIEDNAVTFDKLSDSATVDGDRAVGANHVRNDAIIARSLKDSSVGWTPGGSLAAGTATSFDTTILASTIIPLALRKSFAGVPASPQMSLILSLWNDTNTGKYHLCLYNPQGVSVSLVGMSFQLVYVPAS